MRVDRPGSCSCDWPRLCFLDYFICVQAFWSLYEWIYGHPQARIPADRFNPEGFTEVDLKADNFEQLAPVKARGVRTIGRRGRSSRVSRQDERGNWRAADFPSPGDPNAELVEASQLTWTLACDGEWKVCRRPPRVCHFCVPYCHCIFRW